MNYIDTFSTFIVYFVVNVRQNAIIVSEISSSFDASFESILDFIITQYNNSIIINHLFLMNIYYSSALIFYKFDKNFTTRVHDSNFNENINCENAIIFIFVNICYNITFSHKNLMMN